jgi:hypothetical protein
MTQTYSLHIRDWDCQRKSKWEHWGKESDKLQKLRGKNPYSSPWRGRKEELQPLQTESQKTGRCRSQGFSNPHESFTVFIGYMAKGLC